MNQSDLTEPSTSTQRQMKTCLNLQRGVEWPPRLHKVIWNPDTCSLTPIERRQSRIVDTTLFNIHHHPKSINDYHKFRQIVENRKSAARRLASTPWMKHSVAFCLGPEEMWKLETGEITISERKSITYTNHTFPAFVLFVAKCYNYNDTLRIVENSLGRMEFSEEEYLVAADQFAVELKHGEAPKVVKEEKECRNLLVFEDNFENLETQSSRLLSSFEKFWLEQTFNRTDLFTRQVRFLQFASLEAKRRCPIDTKLRLPMIFTDTTIPSDAVLEDLYLQISYDKRLHGARGVTLEIQDEEDMDWTIKLLKKHDLNVEQALVEPGAPVKRHWGTTNEDGEQLEDRTLDIRGFSHEYWNFEDMKWLVEKICNNNGIKIESLKPIEKEARTTVEKLIDRQDQIVRRIKLGLTDNATGLGFDVEDADAPWNIVPESDLPRFRITFRTVEIGLHILKTLFNDPKFQDFFWIGDVDPELCPLYSKSTRISRRIRAVYSSTIEKLDAVFRKTFAERSQMQLDSMKVREAYYYSVRVKDHWVEDDEDNGTIGVEGWNKELVDEHFEKLKTSLAPIEIRRKARPELFFGIGEAFAMSLEHKFCGELAVDVDKFRSVIGLYGDKAANAYRMLMDYWRDRDLVTLDIDLPIHWPFFNCEAVLNSEVLHEMEEALGVRLELHRNDGNVLNFQGTIEAFDIFTEALDQISMVVFNDEMNVSSRKTGEQMKFGCPKCRIPTILGDYFRLNCGHCYCRDCANGKVYAALEACQFRIPCGIPHCDGFWKPGEVVTLILGGSRRMKELDGSKLQGLTQAAQRFLAMQ